MRRSQRDGFRTRHTAFWPALVAYFLVARAGARLLAEGDLYQRPAVIWILLLMVGMVVFCLATERVPRPWWRRAGSLLVALALFVLMLFPAALMLGGGSRSSRRPVQARGLALLASLPVVALAMRRSRLFTVSTTGRRKRQGPELEVEIRL